MTLLFIVFTVSGQDLKFSTRPAENLHQGPAQWTYQDLFLTIL